MLRFMNKIEARSSHKLSVLLSDEEAIRFESYCAKFGFKKSTLIARIVREFLDRECYEVERYSSVDDGRLAADSILNVRSSRVGGK